MNIIGLDQGLWKKGTCRKCYVSFVLYVHILYTKVNDCLDREYVP